jgi:hypothetical protein
MGDREAMGYQFLIIDMRGRMQKSTETARRSCKARSRTLDRRADLAGRRVGAARVEHGHAHAEAVRGERHHAAELPAAENADALRERARGRRVSARHAGFATNVECRRAAGGAVTRRVSIDTNTTSDQTRPTR